MLGPTRISSTITLINNSEDELLILQDDPEDDVLILQDDPEDDVLILQELVSTLLFST